jgi:DNA-directed RNA polymerase beta' subunit
MASSLYTELSYDRDIRAVTGVQFYVLSPDEIRRQSVCPIVTTDTFCGQEPQIGGLFDARMGTLDPTRLCATCHSRMAMCPGHFGHIELAKPVFHFPFLDVVKKLLRCVCVECSHLMVDLARPDIQAILARKCSAQKRWEVMSKECGKARKCPRCDAMRPDKVSREAVIKLLLEWKDGRRSLLTAEDVLLVLKRISNEHVRALGFSPKDTRPEWMITTVVPVPPPAVRPSVRNDIGQRQEDDLTHKLIDIVKFNGMLRAKLDKGLNNEQIDNWWQLLTYHVCTLTDNQIPGLNPAQQRTGRLLKSVSERLKSKEGRIRGNLLGKRVDFSARTVITPDPCISIEELGVPLRIAQNLTFPQVVTPASQEELRLLVLAGPDQYPGAKYVHKASASRTIRLKGIDRSAVAAGLELGDVVHRHMRDGDWVLFNRQPSLHRMSAMAHKVIVMPDYTFRLNVMVTAPYNADFDVSAHQWGEGCF